MACSPAGTTAGGSPTQAASVDKPASTVAGAQPAADSPVTLAQIAAMPAQCRAFLATMQACITNVAVSNPPLSAQLSQVRGEALSAFAQDPASANAAACTAQADAFAPIARRVGCRVN